MTRFGMKEPHFGKLAEYMADVILRGKDRSREIADHRAQFTTMQYCVPNNDARVKKVATLLLAA